MRKETDLSAVRQMAINFLYVKPEKIDEELGQIFIHHPVLETSYTCLQRTQEPFNIFDNQDKYEMWLTERKEYFNSCNDAYEISLSIRKSYRLTFFKYVHQYLSAEPFAHILREAWIRAEMISSDINVSMRELVSWFKKADKRYLMNNEERKLLSELPNGVLIYRGVGSEDYKYGMSWTLSFERAKWFAERFGSSTQVVYKALVQKQDILAYFADRGEDEVVVDPDVLKKCDIEEVDI